MKIGGEGLRSFVVQRILFRLRATSTLSRRLRYCRSDLHRRIGLPFDLQERGLDLELWLAGKGRLEEELREQREALNLSNRIIFLGMLPHQRLMELYHRGEVDIVALPSVDLGGGEHEGLPVSLMEAMSYRVPVVSTTTGGIPELLGGGAGVMVPPADPTTLAEAIGRLIQDPEQREQQGDAGRKRVEESYSQKEIVGELIARFKACAPVRSN